MRVDGCIGQCSFQLLEPKFGIRNSYPFDLYRRARVLHCLEEIWYCSGSCCVGPDEQPLKDCASGAAPAPPQRTSVVVSIQSLICDLIPWWFHCGYCQIWGRRALRLQNGTVQQWGRVQILVVISSLLVPSLHAPPSWPSRLVYHQGSTQRSEQSKAVSNSWYRLWKKLMWSSTHTAWHGTPTMNTQCAPWLCSRGHPWFWKADGWSGGPVYWRPGLLTIHQVSPRSVGEGICCSQWLYWQLWSQHIASVCHTSSLHTRVVLPPAVMITGEMHLLGYFRLRPSGFATKLLKGYPMRQMAN